MMMNIVERQKKLLYLVEQQANLREDSVHCLSSSSFLLNHVSTWAAACTPHNRAQEGNYAQVLSKNREREREREKETERERERDKSTCTASASAFLLTKVKCSPAFTLSRRTGQLKEKGLDCDVKKESGHVSRNSPFS
jgi:hypothetical protein